MSHYEVKFEQTNQPSTRLNTYEYLPRIIVLTREHCFSVCFYIRVLLACDKYLYVHCTTCMYSSKNHDFCLSPVQECDCKLGRKLYRMQYIHKYS